MLAQILQEMWVDPDVLEALSEDQRRTLFLKMREEQVRRWQENDERDEREGSSKVRARPKKGHSKSVSWLLGRDGDVCVSVIGEVDEFRSSKLLQTLRNSRLQGRDVSSLMNGIHSVSLRTERENHQLSSQPGIRLLFKGDSVAGLDTSKDSEEDQDSGSAEDNPKNPEEDSDSESGSSTDDPKDWTLLYRPHLSSSSKLPLRPQPSLTDKALPQDREESPVFGSRVAQLRRAFAVPTTNSVPVCAKPPVPTKPVHLKLVSTHSLG